MKAVVSRLLSVIGCAFIFAAAWFCLWSISLHLVERADLAVLLFPFGLRLGLMLQCPRGYWPVLLGTEWLLIFWLAQEVALAHPIILMTGSLLTLIPVALISRYRHQRDWRTLLRQGAALIAAALLQSLPWVGEKEVLNALLADDVTFEHPYLTPRRRVGHVCYVAFWGNRGLCGAYNQVLLRHLEQLVHAETRPCSVIVCGRWGRDVLAGTDLPVREICAGLSDTPTMAEALEIAETLKNLYRTGEADEIHLVYQRFDSVLHQTPVHRQLLPAAPEADAPAANNNYLFVPDAQTVLDNVLELYLNNTVYAVMLEARVGEHAARMTAMTAATDSTAELIEELNLDFNRARQAAITTEISEIVGGSAALKQSQGSD